MPSDADVTYEKREQKLVVHCLCGYEWSPVEGFHATPNGYAVDWIRVQHPECPVHKAG
jgi:hypothetical protein